MDTIQQAQSLAEEAGLQLVRCPEGLTLTDGALELRADFAHMLPRIKQGRLRQEMLVRAARVRGVEAPVVVDATAGFGEDSLLLAAAGATVHLFECNSVIAALLADALERALAVPELSGAAARMTLHVGDSISGMAELRTQGINAHVVYLDPMFPGRTKSAAVKKKFQLLHHLEQPCANEDTLMQAALVTATRKVVVKRPIKGPLLAGVKPSSQLKGKAVRYDIVIPPCV